MTLELKVPDMACAVCADKIAKAIVNIDPTAKVSADPQTKLVNIETQQSEIAIKAAIALAGYTVG